MTPQTVLVVPEMTACHHTFERLPLSLPSLCNASSLLGNRFHEKAGQNACLGLFQDQSVRKA
ncbi:MAG: hypothetical protein P8L78_02190 [Mariniblastus sp.]|nr:hypothetical protein [Mariniblastus sp.]MDG2180475.1 hypothetical protein [Mariniblastus sp.]